MQPRAQPAYEIRAAAAADAAALVPLLAELGFPADADEVAARLRSLAALGEQVLVAADGAALLGFVSLHATPVLHRPAPVGRLTALVVAAEYRLQGVGRALLRAAELFLAERGCALIEVTSNQRRTDAHAFYERLGYARTSYRFGKQL